MANKFVSLERLTEYDALIKGVINTGDDATLESANSYTDSKVSNITSGTIVVKEAEHADSSDEAGHAGSADHAESADSATKATQDGDGKVITSTYETKTDASAKLTEAKTYTDSSVDELAANVAYIDSEDNENITGDDLAGNIVIDSALSTVSANPVQNKVVTNKINTISNEIKVERERINQLTSLGEGSTTGDAELVDARTDHTGKTWNNVGEHIRSVSTQLSQDIVDVKNDLVELQDAVFDTQTDFVEVKDVISLPNRIIIKVSDTSFSTQNSDGNIHNIIGCSVSKGERIKIECSTFNNNDVGFGYVWATTEDTPELWNNYNAIPMLSATEYDYICGNTEEQWKTRKVELTVPSGAKKIWVRHMLTPHIYKEVPIRTSKIPTKTSQLENDSGFMVKEEQTKIPVVCFNFDQTALDDRYAILKDYGLTATFGDGDETSTKTLIKNGFDICPYLGSHTLSNISDEAIQTLTDSIATKKSRLESWGLYNPVMCLCSGHKWTYALEQALINNDYNNFHYVRCATQYDKNNDIAYTPTDALPSDRFQYPIAIEQYNVEQIKNIVDNFITKKHPLIMLMMHAFIEDGGSNISKAQFTEIVEYVKELVDAGTVKCMNMRQYYEYYYPEQAKEDDRTRIFSALTN